MGLFSIVLAWLVPVALSVLPSICDDATCVVPESQWFKAENHQAEISAYVNSFSGCRDLFLLDAFGASKAMTKVWRDHRWSAEAFDIKLSPSHDICSREGFFCLLVLGCRLAEHALCFAGPPCSLHVSASQSVHCRSEQRLLGNQRNFKVRLSNRIWRNFVEFLRAILGRNVFIAIEQPTSSWAFRAHLQDMIVIASLAVTLTYMGFFGHDLAKPSHILGNFRALQHLSRTLSRADRTRIAERLVKRNKLRERMNERPKVYYQRVLKADGTPGWQGCKSLPDSAAYTEFFCRAVYACWEASFPGMP